MSADSKTNPSANGAMDPMSAVISFWSQWMEQSTRGTQAILEAMASVSDPKEMERRWVQSMSETAENFMRTPAYMEMMRRNLKAVTDMKRMQDNVVLDTVRHLGLPVADDITGLFERLNSTEQKILGRLKAIEDRLEAIEAGMNGSGASSKKKPSQT
ncbi:MAG: hypothetical protein U0835_19230 [Isosphaeraceae bacterium]